jgi:hypothetical protein
MRLILFIGIFIGVLFVCCIVIFNYHEKNEPHSMMDKERIIGKQIKPQKEETPKVVNEILEFFKELERLVRKDDLIGMLGLCSKPYRESFNNKSLEERLLILANIKAWGVGFTDCKITFNRIWLENKEGTIVTVLVRSVCKNPSTEQTIDTEDNIPLVKEEGGWKIDMARLRQYVDEKLKAK